MRIKTFLTLTRRDRHVALALTAMASLASRAWADVYTFTTLTDPSATGGTFATGVSGSTVVGWYQGSGGHTHGFIETGGNYTTFDVVNNTALYGISGSTLAGWYTYQADGGTLYNGFTGQNTSPHTINTLNDPLALGGTGGATQASGISGSTVIGNYWDNIGNHGFSYTGGVYTTLDVPGALRTYAYGIDGSNIVGYYADGSGTHGFIENGGIYTPLDNPNASGYTTATGVSNGMVVGAYIGYNNTTFSTHGYTEIGGIYTPLDYPGATSTVAWGISGQTVVGYYTDTNGRYHGFTAVAATPPTWQGPTGTDNSWGTATNWIGTTPGAAGDSALFGTASASAGVVLLNAPRHLAKLTFDNATAYSLDPGADGKLFLDNGTSPAAIIVLNGGHAITADTELTSNTTISFVNAGTALTLSGQVTSGAVNTATSLSLTGQGNFLLTGTSTYGGVTNIGAGGTLQVGNGNINSIIGAGNLVIAPGATLASAGVSVGGAWTINGTHQIKADLGNAGTSKVNGVPVIDFDTGQLDLTDSKWIVQTSGGADKTAKIAALNAVLIAGSNGSGSYGGDWTGHGVTSSTITPALSSQYGVGIFNNAQLSRSSFGGQSVDSNSILVHITHLGDADGNGIVDIIDLSIVANAWQQPGNNWAAGDLNGDGVVDIVDFTIVANNWQQTSSFASFPDPLLLSSSPSSVPEPASLAMLGMGAAALLVRRRGGDCHSPKSV